MNNARANLRRLRFKTSYVVRRRSSLAEIIMKGSGTSEGEHFFSAQSAKKASTCDSMFNFGAKAWVAPLFSLSTRRTTNKKCLLN